MSYDNQLEDINSVIEKVHIACVSRIIDDNLWKLYGFGNRPKSGAFFHKVFPKRYELEDFISKSTIIMGSIDIIEGMKNANISKENMRRILIGHISMIKVNLGHLFVTDEFIESLVKTYKQSIQYNGKAFYEVFIKKASKLLNKKDSTKFLVGTVKLLSLGSESDLMLDRKKIGKIVKEANLTGKVNIGFHINQVGEYNKSLNSILDF